MVQHDFRNVKKKFCIFSHAANRRLSLLLRLADSLHVIGRTGDIRVAGFEQAIRYASILLDISDGTQRDYDELFIERNKAGSHWIHFAVRPKENRRKIDFIKT